MSLSSILIERQYHPVILIGVPTSGKTVLLVSLLRYLKADTKTPFSFMLDDPLEQTAEGLERHRLAEQFVNHKVNDFYDRKLPPRTDYNETYFLPLSIDPNNGGATARFAILELSGELLAIDRNLDSLHKELPEDIAQIYESYPEPISIILVGPYVFGDTLNELPERYDGEFRNCDLALEGNLKSYRKYRKFKKNDNIIFLLSKWDARQGPGNPEFLDYPSELVRNLIRDRYPTAYEEFRKMATNHEKWLKQFNVSPYSAGLLGKGRALNIPPEYQTTQNAYTRALWNWLYVNATGEKLYKDPHLSLFYRIKELLKKAVS